MAESSADGFDAVRPADRASLWVPLLRQLTAELPIVFKQSAAALRDVGDVDAYAPAHVSAEAERHFRVWARREGLRVAVVCRHDWRGPTFIAIRDGDPDPFSLDVKVGRFYRGSFLYRTDDLGELSVVDGDGIRHLRVGAHGAIKLLVNATTRGGMRDDEAFQAKGIQAALSADRDGAMMATRLVGPAARAFQRGIDAVLAGGWSRRDMAVVVAWCHARAVARPDRVVRQLHWRSMAAPSCAVARRGARGGGLEGATWLRAVADTHRISGFLGVREDVGDDRRPATPSSASSSVVGRLE